MADDGTECDQRFSWKFYWNVDVPGLTGEQAESIIACYPELPGTVVDPRQWFTVHLDRETAEVLRSALLSLGPDSIGVGLRESVEDWLDETESEADGG